MANFGTPISRVGLAIMSKLASMEKVAKTYVRTPGGYVPVPNNQPIQGARIYSYPKGQIKELLSRGSGSGRGGGSSSGSSGGSSGNTGPQPGWKIALEKTKKYGKTGMEIAGAVGSAALTFMMLKSFVDQARAQKQQDRLYEEQLKAYEEYKRHSGEKMAAATAPVPEEPNGNKYQTLSKEAKMDLLEVGTLEGLPERTAEEENQVIALIERRYGGVV